MAGTLIATGAAVLGKAIGGIFSAKSRRKQQRLLDQQDRNNRSILDRQYYEDQLQRSENQAALTKAQELLRDRYRNAKGRQAVMGGTNDSVTATREANNNVISNITNNIASNASTRRDNAMKNYNNQHNAYLDNVRKDEAAHDQENVKMVENLTQTAGNVASALAGIESDDDEDKNKQSDNSKES